MYHIISPCITRCFQPIKTAPLWCFFYWLFYPEVKKQAVRNRSACRQCRHATRSGEAFFKSRSPVQVKQPTKWAPYGALFFVLNRYPRVNPWFSFFTNLAVWPRSLAWRWCCFTTSYYSSTTKVVVFYKAVIKISFFLQKTWQKNLGGG